MGLEARAQTEEDNLCAEYIRSMLLGSPIDITNEIQALKTTSGAKFFDSMRSDVFPERDFELCTRLGIFDFVLRAENIDGRLTVRRIAVGA